MHQRLARRRNAPAVPSTNGNLWLRSDLRRPAPASQPARSLRRPATGSVARPAVRSWMTWTLFGALLVTTAAAGHGFLATEPKAPPGAEPSHLIAAATEPPIHTEVPAQRAEPASTLPALYALEDTQQQLITQVEAIQASNRALLSRLDHLQAAMAPDANMALAD
ncbi:MAG: hypothetical protein NXH81_01750 [Halieaceae bacterium]|uniref:hypothetical protein n=1 Tax=Haliea alexandrii TaxID=2448162 RepID=UPI000F0B5A13|nr:hypothetical protein [Haliea alexandrii]MCR9184101.1 hypothetical protein [Halieaceae bacterium]